jgi:hypothetical protein
MQQDSRKKQTGISKNSKKQRNLLPCLVFILGTVFANKYIHCTLTGEVLS